MCRVNVERLERPSPRGKFTRRDRLKLEVAYVGGRELYGLPGAEKLEDGPIDRVTGSRGAMSTGSFAMHLRELFQTDHGHATGARLIRDSGREQVRLDFTVPRSRSGVTIFDGRFRDFAGYTATLLLTPGTFDPEWLQVRFAEVPERIRLARSVETTSYHRIRISDRDVSLPASSELELETRSGMGMRNVASFENCRRYGVEATITFGEAAVAPVESAPAPIEVERGLELTTALETVIDDRTAIGDAFSAQVVSGKGLPKGARLTGHITRLQKQERPGLTIFLIGMRVEAVEANGRRGALAADLEQVAANLTGAARSAYQLADVAGGLEPGESAFVAAGRGFPLRPGLRFVWRTR